MPSPADFQQLTELLERRLAIIGDHELRERDAGAQLEQLKEVSEAIAAKHQQLRPQIDARLNHFLENCSYDKALDWIRGLLAKS